MSQFRYINFHWIRRTLNNEANDLAQMASGYKETADGVDVGSVSRTWRLESRYLQLFEGFGSGGTQKDKTQSYEVCSDRGRYVLQDFGRTAA